VEHPTYMHVVWQIGNIYVGKCVFLALDSSKRDDKST
jgi:hypothetical protein